MTQAPTTTPEYAGEVGVHSNGHRCDRPVLPGFSPVHQEVKGIGLDLSGAFLPAVSSENNGRAAAGNRDVAERRLESPDICRISKKDEAVWNGKTLSVILPTYNEKDSIAETIRKFEKLGYIDDILVINNNAAPGTSEEVASTSARELVETRQGYGSAIRRGLQEVETDLICVCEPDGTFNPTDLDKLLPFTRECDLVIGSRTVANFIWDGANMGRFLQWGNWAVAKMIEVLYNTAYLSDVGCTFRVVSRQRAKDIVGKARIDGSSFGLEMLLLAVIRGSKIVQVPVNYHERVGASSVTGDMRKTIKLGTEMMIMVVRMRFRAAALRR